MQFEVIRKSHKKEIIIGVIVFILIAIVLIVHQSFAKYKTVKNMKIAEGTINFKIPDFKIIAMYKQKEGSSCTDDSCYEEITDRTPTSGYVINESKSYCTLDNANKDTSAILKTINGNHVISNLAKNEKCHLYFDKKLCKGAECIIPNVTVNEGTPDFSQVATTDEGVYKATDESGKDSYYFRGAVTNNYVRFANKYWRIIRINGDGSIRLIYDGTSIHNNGTITRDSIAVTSVKFSHKDAYYNSSTDNAYVQDNMYVGFKYTSGQAQGTGTKSNALQQLETWYTSNLSSYASKLDTNAGFCGDRRRNAEDGRAPNGTGGTGTTNTYYAARYRLYSNKTPELSCETADFYTVSGSSKGNKSLTYPIGLITADEVAMAGGVYDTAKQNKSYYLYNGRYYWTLTPFFRHVDDTRVFFVNSPGYLSANLTSSECDVRPVINLRSDVTLTGSGTASDPYVVK